MLSKFTNAFGTITAILTVISGLLVSIGCAPGATDFAATCSIPFLPAEYAPIAAAIFGAITFAMKAFRPGGFLHSMFGSTAVVNSTPGVGSVTPAQVKSP